MPLARIEHIQGTNRYQLLNYAEHVYCLDLDSNPLFGIFPWLLYFLPIKVYAINPATVQKKRYGVVSRSLLIGVTTLSGTYARINYNREIVDLSVRTRLIITIIFSIGLFIIRYVSRYRRNRIRHQTPVFKVFFYPVGIKAKLVQLMAYLMFMGLIIGGLWISIFQELNWVLYLSALGILGGYPYLNLLTVKDVDYRIRICQSK